MAWHQCGERGPRLSRLLGLAEDAAAASCGTRPRVLLVTELRRMAGPLWVARVEGGWGEISSRS